MKKLLTSYIILLFLIDFLFFQIIVRWLEPRILLEQNIVYYATWVAIPIGLLYSGKLFKKS